MEGLDTTCTVFAEGLEDWELTHNAVDSSAEGPTPAMKMKLSSCLTQTHAYSLLATRSRRPRPALGVLSTCTLALGVLSTCALALGILSACSFALGALGACTLALGATVLGVLGACTSFSESSASSARAPLLSASSASLACANKGKYLLNQF